ncbi:hypothetical protein Y032_0127g1383 [Ancylostoma ceylanicum]|uniref:Apple domain-containing protein n=1 Tax=Ancylostoma ceylanicum TaxID=53326 RepID=A0A016T8A6_9BILA|nr:hypothetical protein Y032_0127g1383 [Ancylostoma ceylanicum]
MHSFTAFLFTVFSWAWNAGARSSGFFPMSPRQGESESRVLTSAVHPFFASPNNGAIIDIAVPEEQRLYGRDYRGTLESRPIVHGVQNLRKYFIPPRTRSSEWLLGSSDSAKESSVSERAAANLTLGGSWTCRSVVYDSNWRICDMFAVAATAAPFTLVDYEGRDYFEYLAALPPSDDEISLASNFAQQQQTIVPDNKEKQMCSNDRDKVSGSKTHVVEVKTYAAVPIEEQLKAEEREVEKNEKERGKKERKLQKIIKEAEAVTVTSTTTTQVPLTESPVSETEDTADYERTTIPVSEDDTSDSSTTPKAEGIPEVEQTTAKAEVISPATSRSIRRKPPKKIKDKKAKRDSRKRQKQPQPLQSGSDDSDERRTKEEDQSTERRSQWRRTKKIVRRKPSKVVKTNSVIVTTTEVIQELSPELAREKILLYQKRKAAEAERTTSAPRRRRVRIEGRRLHGDLLEEDEPITRHKDEKEMFREKEKKKDDARISEGSHDGRQKLKKENERKPVKKGLSRRKIPLHQTTQQPSSSASTASTTGAEALPVTTTEPGAAEDALRMALAREIKKFISKELKHKLFRTHGTRLYGESEEVKPPSELVPMSAKPRRRQEEVLPSNICEEHEKVVMMTFTDSTRKPYTAAVEMVKTRDHEECMRLCERSPDCSSAVFSSSLCELSATRARHTIPDIRPSTNDTYIEKACVDSAVIRGRETHITGVANHILAGFVEQVEDAYGVEQCIAACYMALKQYGFHCMSAMWYPLDKEQNCLLNGESRKTQQKLFIAEDTGHQMIYFEHPDAALFRRMHDEIPLDHNSTAEQGWTAWSLCRGNEERVRYSKCKEHSDVRKCPKETAKCLGKANASSTEA